MTDIFFALYTMMLGDMGYHWTDYARCQFPEYGLECVVSDAEMDVLNYLLDKANADEPCYENRYLPIEPVNQDSCPEIRG